MALPPRISYGFGAFRLDAANGTLYRDGRPLRLPVKAIETLRMLVENRSRTVRREELMAEVWAEAFVEEANLTVAISQLRKTLGDNKDSPQFIETAPKRGYRFIAEVTVATAPAEVDHPRRNRRTPALAAAMAAVALLATAVASLLPPRPPRASQPVQLTNSGLVDGPALA